jgi:valyl-tRNA synthetase
VEWAPGTDHAGIATQSVVEKHLAKTRGVDRHQLGRQGLIEEIEKWREQYGGRIHKQMVGASWISTNARMISDEGADECFRKGLGLQRIERRSIIP